MRYFIKFIRKTIGIFFLIEFIFSVYLAFTDLKKYPLAAFFFFFLFGTITFLLLLHSKKYKASVEQTTSFIKTKNVDKTDNSKITDMEISNSSHVHPPHEEITAKWKAPQIIHHIQESYQIMFNTDNPETLCDRYKFAIKGYEELLYYKDQKYFNDNTTIDFFHTLLSTENYLKLIYQCYQKYKSKAQCELKTQNGINNRINKFWKIIQDNVDTNIYSELRKYCK